MFSVMKGFIFMRKNIFSDQPQELVKKIRLDECSFNENENGSWYYR
jgi:hypothetical protein